MRMMAMTIMMRLRQRKDPMPILWRRLIFTFHNSQGGMIRTNHVNARTGTGEVNIQHEVCDDVK